MNDLNTGIQSKYEQVSHVLLGRIRNNQFRTGEMIPSESNLMKEFKVSRVTIRRALAQLIKDGLIRSEQGHGYVVHGQTVRPTVGILYGEQLYGPDDVPTYRLTINALQRILAAHNLRLRLYNVRSHGSELISDREQLISHLRKGVLRGLLAVAWPCPDSENAELAQADRDLLSLIRELKVPFSGLSDELPGAIRVDNVSMSYTGAKCFLDRGLRRIALITGVVDNAYTEQTVAGYRQAHTEAGLEVDPQRIVVLAKLSKRTGYSAFRRLWQQPQRPEAVVVTDDFVGEGVMTAVLELGVDVPGRLQLATFAIRGGNLFFPKPFVRLEIDPEVLAGQISDRLLEAVQHPDCDLAPIVYQPKVVVDTSGLEWPTDDRTMPVASVQRKTPLMAVHDK